MTDWISTMTLATLYMRIRHFARVASTVTVVVIIVTASQLVHVRRLLTVRT